MIKQTVDNITFRLMEAQDFSFLSKHGKVFCAFDVTGSGCISFGVDDGKNKYFIKVAGAKTIHSYVGVSEAIDTLKNAIPLYEALAHPNLIKLMGHFTHNSLYAAVFEWTEGGGLFDYWNFEVYDKNPEIIAPWKRFCALPSKKKLTAFDSVFDFLVLTESKGYAAADFYDGSLIYNFERDILTICDIDFFERAPIVNNMGENFFGSKRFKSPEEYILGAEIDAVTNVFTLGALLIHFFGSYTDAEINRMYRENAFFPCRQETWELSGALYSVVLKAVDPNRKNRHASMKSFYEAWKTCCPTL